MIKEKDIVILIDEKGRKILLKIEGGMKKIRKLGVFNPAELKGKKFGEKIKIGNREFIIIEPDIVDKIETINRKAQIILPKDSAMIIFYCDVKNGSGIVEAGVGSGALTIALANFVRPDGKIISYELRKDFADFAKNNIEKAELDKGVEIKIGDVTEDIEEKNMDAVILDIPNPWDAVSNAYNSLKIGGHFCSYSPTMNQVESIVKTLRKHNFIQIKTFETLQRKIVVGERGVRPGFDMLGHTGYITFARKAKVS